jgi:hypothetical protein
VRAAEILPALKRGRVLDGIDEPGCAQHTTESRPDGNYEAQLR